MGHSLRVNPDVFEKTWNLAARDGEGLDAIAEKLGMTRMQVQTQRQAMVKIKNPDGTPKYILEKLRRGPGGAPSTQTRGFKAISPEELKHVVMKLGSAAGVAKHFGIPYPSAYNLMRKFAPEALKTGPRSHGYDRGLMMKLWNASDDISEFLTLAQDQLGNVFPRKADESDIDYQRRAAIKWQQEAFKLRRLHGEDALKKLASLGPYATRVRVKAPQETDVYGDDMPDIDEPADEDEWDEGGEPDRDVDLSDI